MTLKDYGISKKEQFISCQIFVVGFPYIKYVLLFYTPIFSNLLKNICYY